MTSIVNRFRTACVLGSVTLILSACAPGGGGQASSDVQSPGIAPELKHSWEVAFNQGDAATIANLYSADAELVMSGAPPVRGQANIRSAVEGMIKSGVKVKIDTQQNVGSGDLAYVYGHYAVQESEGGKTVEEGTYIELWRRREGKWLIDLDVNSIGEPAANAAPATSATAPAGPPAPSAPPAGTSAPLATAPATRSAGAPAQ